MSPWIVLAQARAYVCTGLVGGEMRTYAQNGRHKVVSEADVTSSVIMLPNHERFVRLVALVTSPGLHARGQAHVHHAVHCVVYHGSRTQPCARTERLGVDAQLTFVRVRVRWVIPELAVSPVFMLALICLMCLSWVRLSLYFSFNSRRQYSPSLRGSQLESYHPCSQGSGLLRAQPKLSCCSVSEAQKTEDCHPCAT